jgi:heme A synthase
MRMVYKVLAFAVAGLVMLQAAAIAYAIFGLGKWIEGGGTLDASSMENEVTFPGVVGFMIHGMSGTMVIPIVVLLLLVSAFFTKTPGAVRWALIVLGCTVVQIALGIFGHGIPQLGFVHGLFALVLFGAAVMAGMRMKTGTPAAEASTSDGPPLVTSAG